MSASYDTSSEQSNYDLRIGCEAISWQEIFLGQRIQPHTGQAHCTDDLYLLACFLELSRLPDVDDSTVKLLLRTLKLLRKCDYSAEDICSILAHASAYFLDALELCGPQMDTSEVGNVLATLMFVAHCYVQDETCPLHIWHKHLFRKYCPLKTLNSAIIRLLEIRRFVLRVDPTELGERYAVLSQAIRSPRPTGRTCDRDDAAGSGAVGDDAKAAPRNGGQAGSTIFSQVLDYVNRR